MFGRALGGIASAIGWIARTLALLIDLIGSRRVVDRGEVQWYSRFTGALHRWFGPAIENKTLGTYAFYRRGKLHRRGAPAVMYQDGEAEYWIENVHYNPDGPATVAPWAKTWRDASGAIHRDGGLPARECADGTRDFYEHGQFLRREKHAQDGTHTDVAMNRWERGQAPEDFPAAGTED